MAGQLLQERYVGPVGELFGDGGHDPQDRKEDHQLRGVEDRPLGPHRLQNRGYVLEGGEGDGDPQPDHVPDLVHLAEAPGDGRAVVQGADEGDLLPGGGAVAVAGHGGEDLVEFEGAEGFVSDHQ